MDLRLKKEKEFDFVFKNGNRLFSRSLTMVYAEKNQTKVGFAVSKKHGSAVKRNRVKRLLRESFRSFTPQNGQNFFFVFIPKVKENYSLTEYKEEMKFLLCKCGFIKTDLLC